MDPYSVYIHIPFCRHRCGYCDFNTYAGIENCIPEYISALCLEIKKITAAGGQSLPVHTIFWGGGTPSLIPIPLIRQVWEALDQGFQLLPELEVTLEANPGTVSPEYLSGLRQVGFNRISFGMQSARPDELRLLERQHQVSDVIDAVKWARQAGFENLSLDLIYGLPFQTLEDWQPSLETALHLSPDHLSLYALTIEEGTPMFRWRKHGLIAEPDGDTAADMYEWSSDRLEQAGFTQYEISNWARTGRNGALLTCRHNLQYWRDLPYFGLGAGAHGYLDGLRIANLHRVGPYIQACREQAASYPRGPAVAETWLVDQTTEMQETMMVGLRLIEEGVALKRFVARFGREVTQVFGKEIRELIQKGLLEIDTERVRLTRRGRLLGNQVFMEFVGG